VIGRISWPLDRFLADAHRRGVLRQSGTRYVFRHELLRLHLAAGVTGRSPAPVAARPFWHRYRAPMAATIAVLGFLIAFAVPLVTVAPLPAYGAGAEPEQVADVVCVDVVACGGHIRAYRWPLASDQAFDTTFGGHRMADHGRGPGCRYRKGRPAHPGEGALPATVAAIRIAARRRDNPAYTAAALWNEPVFDYALAHR